MYLCLHGTGRRVVCQVTIRTQRVNAYGKYGCRRRNAQGSGI